MTVLYYSVTGNSRYIAECIAEKGNAISLPSGEAVITDDAVGIVVPVQCGKLPPKVSRRLSRISISSPYIFAVVTCGYTPGIAVSQLASILPHLDFATVIKMPDSCLTVRNPEKELNRLPALPIARQIGQVSASVRRRDTGSTRSSIADRVSYFFARILKIGVINETNLHVDHESCSQCGRCIAVCPEGNISYDSGSRIEIGNNCKGCMACINLCSRQVIHCDKEKSHTYRYHHP